MTSLPRRSIRALSALLIVVGLLAACSDQATAPTPTPVAGDAPTIPPVQRIEGTPVPTAPALPPGTDSVALLTALNLPRLDGVTLRVLAWSGSYKNLFTAF